LRKEKLFEDDYKKIKEIVYIIYDYIPLDNPNEIFKERCESLSKIKPKTKKHVDIIETNVVNTEEDIIKFHTEVVKEGFEGVIIRNCKSIYEINKRSIHLQKFKSFDDEEFKIIGYKSGNGIEKDLVIWKVSRLTKNGYKEFYVRPIGDHKERKEIFKNADEYIGKFLTVKFFGYTEDGIPRFPVGMRIRSFI